MFQVGDKVVVVDSPYKFNGSNASVIKLDGRLIVCSVDDRNGLRYNMFQSELEHVYTIHNRHSDTICEVMKKEHIGSWWSGLPVEIPFTHKHEELIYLPDNETACELKEIFFTLMWLVDDETLDAIIKEL